MKITSALFDAYLNCPTKCLLKSKNDQGTGNAYAAWVRAMSESYRNDGVRRLKEEAVEKEDVIRSDAPMQGEGNYSAGRRYDKAQQEFVKSGQVDEAASKAAPD